MSYGWATDGIQMGYGWDADGKQRGYGWATDGLCMRCGWAGNGATAWVVFSNFTILDGYWLWSVLARREQRWMTATARVFPRSPVVDAAAIYNQEEKLHLPLKC
jgi:hypothetical protein